MSNGIYLTLEQYKDKDLPLTITVNGNTYHSQFALATTQTTWFEMGKQHGMELGADNTYSDIEMSRMHDAWYDEGYEAGYNDAKGEDDYCKDCKEEPGKDEQNAKELPGEYLSHIEESDLEVIANKVLRNLITITNDRFNTLERKMDLLLNHNGIGAEDLLVYNNSKQSEEPNMHDGLDDYQKALLAPYDSREHGQNNTPENA